jgi:hypothetical protein
MREIHEGFRRRLSEACSRVRSKIEEALGAARNQGSPPIENDIPRLAQWIIVGFEGSHEGKPHREAETGGERGRRTDKTSHAIPCGLMHSTTLHTGAYATP